MSVETWTERAPSGAPERPAAPPRVGRLRPRLGVADTLLHLWRAKWLMLLVFVPILLIGVAFTLLTPAKYTASTRLLVRLGAEYVFDPVVGDAAKGAFPQQEEVLRVLDLRVGGDIMGGSRRRGVSSSSRKKLAGCFFDPRIQFRPREPGPPRV